MPAIRENRTCKTGRKMGGQISRMTDTEVGKLIADGEWSEDERCKSCAFRHGTTPNGCLQTQLDALKCVLQKETFRCHVKTYDLPEKPPQVCSGWFAAMQAMRGKEAVECPWKYSDPDPKD